MTPAQAYGHPNFVVDVPVQGPTDEGMRAGSCWWARNRLPAQPACVDCGGPVPQWAKNSLCPGNRLTSSGLGEDFMDTISYGGSGAVGFALGGPSDSDIFATLTHDQQQWVQASLVLLNNKIMQSSGTSCATWVDPGVNLRAAVGCFQTWYNTNYTPPKAPGKALRTDGAFDADTLAALQMIAGLHPTDFNVAFPAGAAAAPEKKLSTGAMVGIGVAGAAGLAGLIYAATRGSKGSRRRRRR